MTFFPRNHNWSSYEEGGGGDLVTLLRVFFLPFLVVFPSPLLAHQQQASEIFKYKFEGEVRRILDRTGRKCIILYIFAFKEKRQVHTTWYWRNRCSGSVTLLGLPDPDPLEVLVRKRKKRKTLIPNLLWLLYDFLSLKNYVNVPFCWRRTGSGAKSGFGPDPIISGKELLSTPQSYPTNLLTHLFPFVPHFLSLLPFFTSSTGCWPPPPP